MSARRTERLLNLVICLLATRRWLTKEQIRAAVPQYAACETSEAFDRMFERDKENLRELGVPLLTGSDSSWFEDEVGYLIDRDAYALPELELDAAELAVLGLASRVWQRASLAGPAARALVKLSALGVDPDEGSLVGLEPRVRTAEPAFEPLYAATRDRAPVTFRYRKPDGEVAERHVEPWAVASRGGRWYVVGRDRDRAAARVFRMSRIESEIHRIGPQGSYDIPENLDPSEMIGAGPTRADEREAVLHVRSGRGARLRRRAAVSGGSAGPTVPASPDDRHGSGDRWDEIRLPIGDSGILAEELAGYGPDVVVLEPPDLRDHVVRLLREALATQTAPPRRAAATHSGAVTAS